MNNINKKKNKAQIRHLFAALMATFVVAGCDGISGTGGPSRVADDTQGQTPQDGQAVLGPIVGATVSVRDVEAPAEIICETTTVDNNDLSRAGAIVFSEPCIFADRFYLVTVAGGTDVDFNDDSVRDVTPTPNTGEFRALLTGAQMLQGNWIANALTEAAFQGVQYALAQNANNIGATLDGVAQQFIKSDLNGDGVISRLDIAVWDPVIDADAAINRDKLLFSTQLIHRNINRTLEDVPTAISLEARIDTLAPARQVLNLDDLLLVTTDSALLVYRQTDAGWQLNAHLALGWVYDMAISGKTIYAALGDNGIAAIDVTDAANPQVLQRWSIAARRITTLGERVIFSYRTEQGGLQLRELAGSESRLIANSENERVDRLRSFSSDDAARDGLLKTLGNTVYWSTQGRVHSFAWQDGEWINRELPTGDFEFQYAFTYAFDIVEDIEIRDNIAYIVVRYANDAVGVILDAPEIFDAIEASEFDYTLQMLDLRRGVIVVDISDVDNPVLVTTVMNEDIEAVRRWDDTVVALGARSISMRNAVDLKIDAQIALPSSFSGFDQVHGLTRVGNTIVVAARENGVLLLKPPGSEAHFYTGHVMAQAAISDATVTVTRLSDEQLTCTQASGVDGTVTIPSDCLSRPGYYLLSASGGTQMVDGASKPFTGELRSVMLSNTIAQSGWNITPLTDLALRIAQTGDGAGFGVNAFVQARDDIADWLLAGVRSAEQYAIMHDAMQLYAWQPDPALHTLSIEQQLWRSAAMALGDGSFDNAMLARLMAPVTNLLTFDDNINDVTVSDDMLFIAHDTSIDVVDRTVTPWQRHTIRSGADRLRIAGNKLVALDRRRARVDFYSLGGPDNIQHVASVPISDFNTSMSTLVCLSENMLYQVSDSYEDMVNDTFGSTFSGIISAWRIGEAGATALPPLRLSMHMAMLTSDDLRCNDSVLVEKWNDWSDNIDIFHVDGNIFERTATINALPIYGFDLHGSQLAIYSYGAEGFGDKLSVYSIDSNGGAALVQQGAVALSVNNANAVQTRVRSSGNSIAIVSMNDVTLFDADTLQLQGSLSLHFNALYLTASDEDLWIWGLGNSIWQLGLPAVP